MGMPFPFKKYPATISLLMFLGLLLFYRVALYEYPDMQQRRNPVDFVWDVCGFSYHFVLLGWDIGQGSSTRDYHARAALRYKPGDAYISRFVSVGKAKQ
jgi:hypothetical protein